MDERKECEEGLEMSSALFTAAAVDVDHFVSSDLRQSLSTSPLESNLVDNHGVNHESVENPQTPNSQIQTLAEENNDEYDDRIQNSESPHKKQKTLASLSEDTTQSPSSLLPQPQSKKSSKKKSNNVWTKSTSRKGKKKSKSSATFRNATNGNGTTVTKEDIVYISPIPRFPDKSDDSEDAVICLSRVYKAEKVELSEDRLSAGSSKGYRMVRATRGVDDGAWYFEIKVTRLGETGHTRLGLTTDKGDLQAPVGYDGNSFGYRDIDGSKVHKALREKYGEDGYMEGDVIGVYINLPNGKNYVPKPPVLVLYKGQRYLQSDGKDDLPKIVPESEVSFFKNGVCQGVAFRDLYGGRYFPAASMYTLPNQPNCQVTFNFGPDFECFPTDFGDRPIPKSMIEVPYLVHDRPDIEAATGTTTTAAAAIVENGLSENKN
ncbi:hypothetical protein ZOSMA_72G00640 [Zostera marina]|uniref:B30.2/SPRY domain-containing protein n=1 Tax=Zostera marina TaxID=29655 RepID=A0A0K9NQL8_ZOSMR|nr:hypothetical protein ZOSMA_72G00640 [Zostera marina]